MTAYQNQPFKINGKVYRPFETALVNRPGNMPIEQKMDQKKYGYKIIYGSTSALYYVANTKTVSCIIYYNYQPEITDEFIRMILGTAVHRGCDVYIRVNKEFYEFTEECTSHTKRDDGVERRARNDLKSKLSLENDIMHHKARVTERGKLIITKFIRLYQLDYPTTAAEWFNTYIQIKYYAKHKIKFAFDKNLYKICPECHELIRRGAEDEHICYCDLAPKKVHMDYIVNGDADNQEVEEWD